MNEWKKELIDMKTEINDKIIVKGSGIHCSKSKEFSKDVRPLWIILILAIIGIIAINLINPVSASLGSFDINECVNIVTNLNATSVNLTNVMYPSPNNSVIISNQPMSANGNFFNYTLCNTSVKGTYTYGYCDNIGNCYSNDFFIGKQASISQAILYVILLIGLISVFILTLYSALKIKWKPDRDNDGRILTINKLRYLKIILIPFVYIELMWLMGILYSISYNFLTYDTLSQFFDWGYTIMISLWIPITFGAFFFAFIIFISDKKLRKRISRGFNR